MATAISSTPPSTATTANSSTNPLSAGPGGPMGKDQFLKLLVAQMKNQDPLNPTDGTQMASQLAQFSSVEQLEQINTTLATQSTGQSSVAQLLAENGALASVGKSVVVDASAIRVGGAGAPQSIVADLPEGTSSATLKIYDANGTEVASQALGSVGAGRKTFAVTGAGKALTAGTYKYVVEASNSSGTVTNAATSITGKVSGVRYTSAGPVITVDGADVPYMSVTEITG